MAKNSQEVERLRIEDFPGADENLKRLIIYISRFTEQVGKLIDGQLLLGENVQAQIVTINNFTPEQLPLRFQTTIPQKTTGVLLAKIETSSNNYVNIGSAVYLDWRQDGSTILITGITGLTAATKYDMTVVAI